MVLDWNLFLSACPSNSLCSTYIATNKSYTSKSYFCSLNTICGTLIRGIANFLDLRENIVFLNPLNGNLYPLSKLKLGNELPDSSGCFHQNVWRSQETVGPNYSSDKLKRKKCTILFLLSRRYSTCNADFPMKYWLLRMYAF